MNLNQYLSKSLRSNGNYYILCTIVMLTNIEISILVFIVLIKLPYSYNSNIVIFQLNILIISNMCINCVPYVTIVYLLYKIVHE